MIIGRNSPFVRLAEQLTVFRFPLRACEVCLVGENLTFYIQAV